MRYLILTLIVLACAVLSASGQLNVELLHQLVQHSKDEYSRQQTARSRQAVTSANEEVNRAEMDKLKSRYRELHSRFQTLGTALEALSLGMESAPIVTEIITQQRRIIGIASDHPELVPLATGAERDMAERAVQLGRYLAGLFICAGDLNQMKASDRRVLYGHVIAELRTIAGASRGLAGSMQHALQGTPSGIPDPFGAFVNEDRRIARDILRRLEGFRP